MAYTLQILIQILEEDQHHLLLDTRSQIETFLDKARAARDLLGVSSIEEADLCSRIRDVAYMAEDLIESHIRDRVLSVLEDDGASGLDLKDVMEELDSIGTEIRETQKVSEPVTSAPGGVSSSALDLGSVLQSTENTVVGLTTEVIRVLDELFCCRKSFHIIAISGMAGIGKTTLAYQIYNNAYTVNRFDCRAWITFPQKFDIQMVLLAILDSLGYLTDAIREENYTQLSVTLYQSLFGRRYFIILDDVWDTEAWNKLRRFFPDNRNGSRVLLTTRDRKLADDITYSRSRPHQMPFMNDSASWNLLCSTVFGDKASCPPELEKIGNKIANRCQGLPLAVTLIARLLLSNMKPDHWKHVAMNVSSMRFLLDSDSHTLLRSYNNLPCHLKPCFLYMGIFPEGYAIKVSRIIKLWIAEGFVKQTTEILENTGKKYLKALLDANLLLVCEKEHHNGRVRTFKFHFLFREICKDKAFEEKFLWFRRLEDHDIPEDEDHLRRVGVHPLVQPSSNMKSTPFVRSFLCVGPASRQLAPLFLASTLLRVLDVFQLEFFHFPTELQQLVHLRFLALSCHSDIPSSICRLKNLQTLVIRRLPSSRAFSLPSELWELSQLRHMKCTETCIWYFPKDRVCTPQENLQTLSNLQMFVVTDEFLGNIPNLRKLGLFCNKAVHSVIHLDRLSKLEKLKCSSNLSHTTHNFLSYLTLPPSLTKLTLSICKIPWGFMENVGQLPNLEQLILQKCSFLGIGNKPIQPAEDLEPEAASATWELVDQQFNQLRFLQMEGLNLVHWRPSDTSLPRLQHLVIRGCCSMMEIPLEIGEIPTLELIEVDEYCSHSVVASAKKILEVQIEAYGNHELQVHVGSTRGTSHPSEHQALISLNKHIFERKQDMEAKRKSYAKKLKERVNLN